MFDRWSRVDLGLLVVRVGVGVMFMTHGFPKMIRGPEGWAKLGGTMANFGIEFLPAVWGFLGAFSELVGGLLLALGLFFRPALVLLAATMVVATRHHFARGDSLTDASHAIEAGILFVGLFLTGPGRHALDATFGRGRG